MSKKEVIILVLILLICIGILIFKNFSGHSSGNIALIKLNGEVVQSIDLKNSNDKIFEVSKIEGVTFEIQNCKIRFLENDCKNQVCVNTGYISQVGDVAVCLPKKISIEIVQDY